MICLLNNKKIYNNKQQTNKQQKKKQQQNFLKEKENPLIYEDIFVISTETDKRH